MTFVALEDAFRDVRLDELQLVKTQGDRHGRLAADPSWSAWAAAELKRRSDGSAPVLAAKSEAQEAAEAAEAAERLANQEARWAQREAEARTKAGHASRAKRRWAKVKLVEVQMGGALKQANQAVKKDPLERGRAELIKDQFGKELLPAPQEKSVVPFSLDTYVYGLNPKQRQLFAEPHRPDPYRDVPLLEKGMELSTYPVVPFARPDDLARYRRRRHGRLEGFMEDAVRQDTNRVPATASVLGGSRYLQEEPNKPPVVRQAAPAIKDMDAHERKVSGIRKYVELMGLQLREPPDMTPVLPFAERPKRDLHAPARPMEIREFHGASKKRFADVETLPRFPLLSSPEKAIKAAAEAERKKGEKASRKAKTRERQEMDAEIAKNAK